MIDLLLMILCLYTFVVATNVFIDGATRLLMFSLTGATR